MRKIYLSPHLDDAILSCGGVIFEERKEGDSVEIWNFMNGIPSSKLPLSDLARSVHAEWGLGSAKEVLDLRLTEDRISASRVNALPRYFGFLDCIYRHDKKGTPLYAEDIFVAPHPADTELVDKIAIAINENIEPDDVLICPLTIGNHPDHVIVRRAAEKTGHPLSYYADIPYALRFPGQLTEITKGLAENLHRVSDEGLDVWQGAASAYSSQLDVLFGGEEMMKAALKLNWRASRGVYLYQKN
ncbi:MAG: hypothetical protein HN392_05030 [Anaerolineae bacterium]|jgi:LmbE family N-acetylglucosaminyl deacetylase|nr:hypothetical protein [Anaerolineae bacterium]MBT7076059.1 hypothetical protein [Anaerolineae bacterium]MBT7782663.1 hypothetical protein [Anaerolineae bacterium]